MSEDRRTIPIPETPADCIHLAVWALQRVVDDPTSTYLDQLVPAIGALDELRVALEYETAHALGGLSDPHDHAQEESLRQLRPLIEDPELLIEDIDP